MLELMESKIGEHFKLEKEMKTKLCDEEEHVESIQEQMSKTTNQFDNSNIIRLNNLRTQLEDNSKKYQELVQDRNTLYNQVQDMGLEPTALSHLNNIFAKEKVMLEHIEARKNERKNEKTLNYRDWIIEFLKNQVSIR